MVLIYIICWLHHIDHTALQRCHNLQHLYTASKLCINIDVITFFIRGGSSSCVHMSFCNNFRICLINIFEIIFYLTYLLSHYISSVGWVPLVLAYVRRVHPCTTLSAVGQMSRTRVSIFYILFKYNARNKNLYLYFYLLW